MQEGRWGLLTILGTLKMTCEIMHLVRLFLAVQGQWWLHWTPRLAHPQVSWTRPRGWSLRACWVCWGQLCPPGTCCSGPEVSHNTGRSKTTIVFCAQSWRNFIHRMSVRWFVLVPEIQTSIVKEFFTFLQEAEMVSEVANSKYQSLFFILKNNREQECYWLSNLLQNSFGSLSHCESSPAVEPLGVFLSHGVEAMSNRGVLHTWTHVQSY